MTVTNQNLVQKGIKRRMNSGDACYHLVQNILSSHLLSKYLEIGIIKFMRWAGHVTQMGEKRNAYRLLVGRPEGKRPLGRPRCRWVNNIMTDLADVGWDGVDWTGRLL
jgi:hypothetical protein